MFTFDLLPAIVALSADAKRVINECLVNPQFKCVIDSILNKPEQFRTALAIACGYGDRYDKIATIKSLRLICDDLGLKDAKDIVEYAAIFYGDYGYTAALDVIKKLGHRIDPVDPEIRDANNNHGQDVVDYMDGKCRMNPMQP